MELIAPILLFGRVDAVLLARLVATSYCSSRLQLATRMIVKNWNLRTQATTN